MRPVQNIFKGDKVIWIIFILLCALSLITVFSAASRLTYKSGNHWAPIQEHATILAVGFLVVILVHHIHYRWFQVFPFFLIPASAVMLIITTVNGLITGVRINGAARWMILNGVQFQPSELAKMAVIVSAASILSKMQDENEAKPKAFKYIMIITGMICLLIAPENLSTALLLFGVVFLMMIIGRIAARKLWKLTGILALIAGLSIAVGALVPKDSKIPLLHRLATWESRIVNFGGEKIPAAKYDIDKNGQVAHAHIAIASSNIIGKGPGNSIERDFLSQASSDFIFAIVIEELGLLFGAILVLLYIFLLFRAGRIAKKCNHAFPAFLVIGIVLLLVSQAMLNMMVTVGLFPVTGQPLPFISKGGTSTLINCVYIGMILSISRYTASLDKPASTVAQPAEEEAAEPTAPILNSDIVFKKEK